MSGPYKVSKGGYGCGTGPYSVGRSQSRVPAGGVVKGRMGGSRVAAGSTTHGAKKAMHSGPSSITSNGGGNSGPYHTGKGFSATKSIPYKGKGGGSKNPNAGTSLQGWRMGRQRPQGGPIQTEGRRVKKRGEHR